MLAVGCFSRQMHSQAPPICHFGQYSGLILTDLQAIRKQRKRHDGLEMRTGTPTHGANQRSDVFQTVLDQRQRPVPNHVFEVLVKSVCACGRVRDGAGSELFVEVRRPSWRGTVSHCLPYTQPMQKDCRIAKSRRVIPLTA